MSTSTIPARPNLFRLYAKEAKYELLKTIRMPAYAIPVIAFPVVFYALFGLSFRAPGTDSNVMATYLIATYGAFGVIGAALFGFGVGVATERGQGWMLLKRATPMPPLAYFTAKAFSAATFGVVIVLSLFALGAGFGDVRLPAGDWVTLFSILVLGSAPFAAIGMALGFLCGPNSAPAVVNLVYLPSAFASGLWMPLSMLPGFFRALAPWLPPYHLGQLALKVVGMDEGVPAWQHVAALLAFTGMALVIAAVAYRRGGDKTYG